MLLCVLQYFSVFNFVNNWFEVVKAPENVEEATEAMKKLIEPKVEEIIARIVVSKPSKYLPQFLDHWRQNLPDLSEGRVPKPDRLQFWKNLKCCAGLHPHCDLSGLCRKWCHIDFDFAISRNQWPVIFHKETESNQLYDMTVPFTLTVWVCYCAQMNGSPALRSKSNQAIKTKKADWPAHRSSQKKRDIGKI